MKNLIKTFVCMAMAIIFICPVSREGDGRTERVAPSDTQIIKDIRNEGMPVIGTDDTMVNCRGTYQTETAEAEYDESKPQEPLVINNESAMATIEDELIIEYTEKEEVQVSSTPTQQTNESDYIYTEPVIIEQEESYETYEEGTVAYEDEPETNETQVEEPVEGSSKSEESYEEPEPVEESVATASYSGDDLYVLAHVICGEAMECSWDMQAAVGSVVLNRVNHYAFPNSIYGVVFDYGQYACTWDGNYYREPTSTNWEVAEYLLNNGSTLPWYVIFQADRVIGNSYYTTIGNMVFSYNSWDAY